MIACAAIFIFYSSQGNSNSPVKSQDQIEEEQSSKDELQSMEPPAPANSPEPTPSSTPVSIQAQIETKFVFTPTGISLSWTVSGVSQYDYAEIRLSEDGGSEKSLGKFKPGTQSLELIKEDNQGQTSFKAYLHLENGQVVIAPSLDVRGKFSAN